MPELATLAPARPTRPDAAQQPAAANTAAAAPTDGFLGQLEQLLAGSDTAAAQQEPANPPGLTRQTNPAVAAPGIPIAAPPAPLAAAGVPVSTAAPAATGKKLLVPDGPSKTGDSPPDQIDPAASTVLPVNPAAPVVVPLPPPPTKPDSPAPLPTADHVPAATAATAVLDPGKVRSNGAPAANGLPTPAADTPASDLQPAQPAVDPALSKGQAPKLTNQPAVTPTAAPAAAHATAASASTQSTATESRRTKLAAADTVAAAATIQAEASASPAAPSSAPAAPSAPHPAALTLLQATIPQAASSSTPVKPIPPALQVAQAVAEPVRVILASPPQQSGGPQVTTIQLDPVELGRVEIRIERSTDGPAKVELAAERPDTLLRLVHDQPQLQHALDQAGIPQSGRTITFSLAPDNASTSASFSNSADNGNQNGQGQRSQQGYAGPNATASDIIDSNLSSPVWTRTGLDITA